MASINAVTQSGKQALANGATDVINFDSDCNVIEVWADGPCTFSVDKSAPQVGSVTQYSLPDAGARQVPVPTAGKTMVRVRAEDDINYLITKVS